MIDRFIPYRLAHGQRHGNHMLTYGHGHYTSKGDLHEVAHEYLPNGQVGERAALEANQEAWPLGESEPLP